MDSQMIDLKKSNPMKSDSRANLLIHQHAANWHPSRDELSCEEEITQKNLINRQMVFLLHFFFFLEILLIAQKNFLSLHHDLLIVSHILQDFCSFVSY